MIMQSIWDYNFWYKVYVTNNTVYVVNDRNMLHKQNSPNWHVCYDLKISTDL